MSKRNSTCSDGHTFRLRDFKRCPVCEWQYHTKRLLAEIRLRSAKVDTYA